MSAGGCTYNLMRRYVYYPKDQYAVGEVERWRRFQPTRDYRKRRDFDKELAAFVRCHTAGNNNRKCCRRLLPPVIAGHCENLCDGKRPPTSAGDEKYELCFVDPRAREMLDTCNREAVFATQRLIEDLKSVFGG